MDLRISSNINHKNNVANNLVGQAGTDVKPAILSKPVSDSKILKQPEASKRVKRGVLLTTLLGTATGLAISLKRGGFSVNPAKMFKGSIKSSGLAKVNYDAQNVMTLAACSISGGLIGGTIFDKKENMKAKYREAVIQMLGNIMTPLTCVAGGMNLFDKHANDKIIKSMKLTGKMAALPKVLASGACLFAGIVGGNKVGNLLNEKIYHIKDDRGVKFADMSGHIDDCCLAISFADPKSMFGGLVSRIIPAALLVCGYSSGVKQEWPDEVKAIKKTDSGLINK